MIYSVRFFTPTDGTTAVLRTCTPGNFGYSAWIATKVTVEPLKARTSYVEVPGQDGHLDYTEALGLNFANRKITITLETKPGVTDYLAAKRELYPISGKLLRLREDHIAPYQNSTIILVWGRVSVKGVTQRTRGLTATIEMDARPFAQLNSLRSYYFSPATTEAEMTIDVAAQDRGEFPELYATGGDIKIYDANGENEITLARGKTLTAHPYIHLDDGATTITARLSAVTSGARLRVRTHGYTYY